MELGLTFPLQRFLKRRPPPYGAEPDRRSCWDLHVITMQGNQCLLAVHCHSRYTFVLYDVAPFLRADLPGLFRTGLTESLNEAGFDSFSSESYLRRAGVTPEQLQKAGEITTSFGQTLSWKYLCWVREHPLRWTPLSCSI